MSYIYSSSLVAHVSLPDSFIDNGNVSAIAFAHTSGVSVIAGDVLGTVSITAPTAVAFAAAKPASSSIGAIALTSPIEGVQAKGKGSGALGTLTLTSVLAAGQGKARPSVSFTTDTAIVPTATVAAKAKPVSALIGTISAVSPAGAGQAKAKSSAAIGTIAITAPTCSIRSAISVNAAIGTVTARPPCATVHGSAIGLYSYYANLAIVSMPSAEVFTSPKVRKAAVIIQNINGVFVTRIGQQ